MLQIAAVSCEGLNVDLIGQGKRLFCRKYQGKSIGFHEKVKVSLSFLVKNQESLSKSPHKPSIRSKHVCNNLLLFL